MIKNKAIIIFGFVFIFISLILLIAFSSKTSKDINTGDIDSAKQYSIIAATLSAIIMIILLSSVYVYIITKYCGSGGNRYELSNRPRYNPVSIPLTELSSSV